MSAEMMDDMTKQKLRERAMEHKVSAGMLLVGLIAAALMARKRGA